MTLSTTFPSEFTFFLYIQTTHTHTHKYSHSFSLIWPGWPLRVQATLTTHSAQILIDFSIIPETRG